MQCFEIIVTETFAINMIDEVKCYKYLPLSLLLTSSVERKVRKQGIKRGQRPFYVNENAGMKLSYDIILS